VSNPPPHPTGPPVPPPPWPPAVPSANRRQWPMFAFLLVAFLVTLGVAIVGWFRPVPAKQPAPPTYSAQQVADAKTKVCAEYQRVHSAIKASTARDMGTDPTAQQVYGLTGRQALLAGSAYLRTVLSGQPATPNEIATTIRKLTDLFQELAIDYLNSMPDSDMEPTVHAADEATLAVERLCK
jgi:cytoskeletal protein RodZ